MSDTLRLVSLVQQYLRTPTQWPASGPVFEPPLSVAEQATFSDLQIMAAFGITANLTLAEFQAIKADLATGKAFIGIASPTLAQAVAAEKAVIRVLGALLRS